ncbi:MAG: NAD(+)/NADH kinase [Lachnospiraceae bacterium]|nr:NAD(+)/NADH kinase [Lachnospiraceae bacterium]
MRTFHIMTNAGKDTDQAVTNRIADFLGKKGCTVSRQTLLKQGGDETFALPAGAECVIVVGGDGTMIRAADLIAGKVPMVGVNLGTLGFLEEIEIGNLEESLTKLIAGDFDMETRMMLAGSSVTGHEKWHALNDIVIARNGSLRILEFEIYVNEMLLATYTADGMIVSTPTGSTAYNLSAGGPIVEPDASAILLTPICPHNLNSRAIVLSADDVVKIRILDGRSGMETKAAASFDGGRELELLPNESITISAADIVTKLIRLNKESFLKTLSRKMAVSS